jgi:hypothetical protein
MYYKGNTIGLNYDAATGNWSFSNEPNDFIDTNAFSTADPKFDYVPPSNTTPDETENDPCPPGYKYDNSLKQCVIDPDYQNPFADTNQTTGGGGNITPQRIAGTDRTTTDNNFIATDDEYNKMTASELIENYKQRGFVKLNDKGQLVVDLNRVQRKGGVLDVLLGRVGQPQVEGMASLNKVIDYLVDKNIVSQNEIYGTTAAGQTQFNNEIVIPTIAKFEADYYGIPYSDVIAPGFGDRIFGTKESVQQFDDFMAKKLAAFSTVANNAISNYKVPTAQVSGTSEEIDKASDLANIERRKKEAEARAAEIKAKQEEEKLKELAAQGSGTSEEADKAIDKINRKKDDDKDDGGTGGGGIVIGPNPGDAGGTTTYSSGSSAPSTGQSVGPAGAPVSVTQPSSAAESFRQYGRF